MILNRWFGARPAQLHVLTAVPLAALIIAIVITLSGPAHAMKIQTIKSPGGIEAWLVEEHSVPMMAMRFAFEGGSSQDPAGERRRLALQLYEDIGEKPPFFDLQVKEILCKPRSW